jgi:hypothetical protein
MEPFPLKELIGDEKLERCHRFPFCKRPDINNLDEKINGWNDFKSE